MSSFSFLVQSYSKNILLKTPPDECSGERHTSSGKRQTPIFNISFIRFFGIFILLLHYNSIQYEQQVLTYRH